MRRNTTDVGNTILDTLRSFTTWTVVVIVSWNISFTVCFLLSGNADWANALLVFGFAFVAMALAPILLLVGAMWLASAGIVAGACWLLPVFFDWSVSFRVGSLLVVMLMAGFCGYTFGSFRM